MMFFFFLPFYFVVIDLQMPRDKCIHLTNNLNLFRMASPSFFMPPIKHISILSQLVNFLPIFIGQQGENLL